MIDQAFLEHVAEFFADPDVVRWLQNAACAAGCGAGWAALGALCRRIFKKKDVLRAAPQAAREVPEVNEAPPQSRACTEALRLLANVSATFYNDVNHTLFVPGLLVRFSCEGDRPPVASVLVKPQLKNGTWEGTELSSVLDPDEQQVVFEHARERRADLVARIKRERNERLGYEMAASRMAAMAGKDPLSDVSAPVYAKAGPSAPNLESQWSSLR